MPNYLYDKEADVFYFAQGKLNARDETYEAGDDIVIHVDPHTHKIRGFTLINASYQADIGEAVARLELQDEKNLAAQAQEILRRVLAHEIALAIAEEKAA